MLQGDPANFLPETPATPAALRALAATMTDPGSDPAGDASLPAVYTYLGQFIDHDITLDVAGGTDLPNLLDPNVAPLALAAIAALKNGRTPTLELDSLYGPPAAGRSRRTPQAAGRPGHATSARRAAPTRPTGKGDDNDLPREPRSADMATTGLR